MSHPHLAMLQASAEAGRPIIVSGVGSGLTAQGAVQGGADLLAVYNTAVYRLRNLPSILAFLPGEDPNQVTRTAAVEVIANAGTCPVLLGFAAHNPHLSLERLIDEAVALGGSGVTNEPFAGLYGESFRTALERAGCGFSRELQLIEAAKARGLLTLGWACDPQEADRMAAAGADLVGLMLGITTEGSRADLQDALERTRLMADAARARRGDVLLLAHGGPLTQPEHLAAVQSGCGVHGYVTGSSAERNPVVDAVRVAVAGFRQSGPEMKG